MNEEDIKIDRYLAGSMNEPEASAFAAQMDVDEQLRQKVNLRQELINYLGSGELALMELLEEAGEVEDKRLSSLIKGWQWWLLLVVILLGLLLVWQQALKQTDPPVTLVENETINEGVNSSSKSEILEEAKSEVPDSIPALPPASAPAAAAPTPSILPGDEPSLIPPPEDSEPEAPDTLIYASLDPVDFALNPYLEGIVTTGLRADEDAFTLSLFPETDTVRRTENPILLITTKANQVSEVELLIYDNVPESFLEELPIQQLLLSSWEELNGEKVSRINLVGFPRPGRYYLLLVDDEGDFLAGKRLLVR